MRNKIYDLSVMDSLIELAEGNPGAASILARIAAQDGPSSVVDLLHLDDMNIRGVQIWVGYKDHCNSDLDKFLELVRKRDPGLIATINRESGSREIAVASGASFLRQRGRT